ncbi:MAG: dihydroorotate dehydrogenase electron transfer subunit [Thermodesulfovibrionales bacterium]|nr:dihydroorotate dehydrogenase electron transfer subunit [Thermodesulfovibrionales bacterium]
MHRYFKAKITGNTPLNEQFRLLTLIPLSEIEIPSPGQFYMLQASSALVPLLKRPFSIFEHQAGTLKFLYRIRGKGTSCLAGLGMDDTINVIGPLGNSYPEPQEDFIAVAGGIGIASLLPLLSRFKKKAYLFYGARNSDELVMLNEAKSLSKEVAITTDDGSEGQKGLITDVLRDFLNSSRITYHALQIYACGPMPMIKELSSICMNKGLRCYASFEEHMACGVGACHGCVIKVRRQNTEDRTQKWIYERVCKEGPVFDVREIVWE